VKNEYLKKVINYFGSQTRLAEELGVSRQSVSMWYNGAQSIPLIHALNIQNISNGKFKYTKLLDKDKKCYLKKN
jgi:DNA-binding transcriptional regulator YdaS (Cro superfamily)